MFDPKPRPDVPLIVYTGACTRAHTHTHTEPGGQLGGGLQNNLRWNGNEILLTKVFLFKESSPFQCNGALKFSGFALI